MTHASLFSGIGGFDLAAEWCGWENSFQCEIDPFCQKVLAKNFPNADRHTDIFTFNATTYRGAVDIISGGFPCQTYSLAGLGAMDAALWLQMLRIIGECRPGWVVAENVLGFAQREQGLALERVCADLEAAGYTVFPPLVLPAAAVGAPHERQRVWIIAHANSERREKQSGISGASEAKKPTPRNIYGQAPGGKFWLFESPLYGANDGLSGGLVRPVKHQRKQLKAYGNSIVPQVAFEIFQAINQVEA